MRKQGLAGLSDDRSSEAWDKLYTFDTKQQQETKKERHTVHDGGFFASMAKLSASKPTLVEFTPEERRIVLEDLITHRAAVAIAEEDLEAPTPAAATPLLCRGLEAARELKVRQTALLIFFIVFEVTINVDFPMKCASCISLLAATLVRMLS